MLTLFWMGLLCSIPKQCSPKGTCPILDPKSAKWFPSDHVAQYLQYWVRCPMSKKVRSKLRAECSCSIAPRKVCDTPVVDPKMVQFLAKTVWKPRKGLESTLKSCQDKLLDIFGSHTKLFKLAENAKAADQAIDPHTFSGWIEKAICIAGNCNKSFSIEKRKAILFQVEAKLALNKAVRTLRTSYLVIFFVKDLGCYIGEFTAIAKTYNECAKSFMLGFRAGLAGPGGRLCGCNGSGSSRAQQGSFKAKTTFQGARSTPSFFMNRSQSLGPRHSRRAPRLPINLMVSYFSIRSFSSLQ